MLHTKYRLLFISLIECYIFDASFDKCCLTQNC